MNLQKKNYDSAFCGSLPLHHLNVIQPHGVLLAVNKKDKRIVQASENIINFLGLPAQEVVNKPLDHYLDAAGSELLNKHFEREAPGKIPLTLRFQQGDRVEEALGVTHIKGEFLIIELFPASWTTGGGLRFIDLFQQIKYIMASLEAAQTVEELCHIAAHELRAYSGFDKVLIYHFDDDWNGKVVAEEKVPEMEAYLGLTFPASDIPKQARQLYIKNPYRLIPNRMYEPVKIYPVINPVSGAFLDLSDCDIRGVAGVHLEYMKNMQISASMSTRILLNETELWGLISCHHRTPKYLDYEACSVFELISAAISNRLALLSQREQYQQYARLQELQTRLMNQVFSENGVVSGLLHNEGELLELVNATGVVITYAKSIHTAGAVPSRTNIKDLILWLQSRNISGIYKEDSLPTVFDGAISYADTGSGILVVPVNPQNGEFIVFFRPEVVREVEWGGNPNEAIQFEKDSIHYHPRNSFQVWQQVVKYTSLPWKKWEVAIAGQFRYFLLEHIIKSSTNSRFS